MGFHIHRTLGYASKIQYTLHENIGGIHCYNPRPILLLRPSVDSLQDSSYFRR